LRQAFIVSLLLPLLSVCGSLTIIHVQQEDDIRLHYSPLGTRIIVEEKAEGVLLQHQQFGPGLLHWPGGLSASSLYGQTQLVTAPDQACAALYATPLTLDETPPPGHCAPAPRSE
jgi:hypothetical protein